MKNTSKNFKKLNNINPIGVFDSGLGGLTVLKELISALPNENFIYLGDTANVPYGEKNDETLIKLAKKNIDFLISKNCKIICAACGTISSLIEKIDIKQFSQNTQILEIIKPICNEAIIQSNNKKIGIIATNSAINSNSFLNQIKNLDSSIQIFQKGCPKFVDIIENGSLDDKNSINLAINEYLSDFKKEKIDTLILGCTHFPILHKSIDNFLDKKVKLIDSGLALAKNLRDILKKSNCENSKNTIPYFKFYFTKATPNLTDLAKKILNRTIDFDICEL